VSAGRDARAARRARLGLALAGRIVPGVARVHDQIPGFARDWRAANEAALAGSGPLWVALGDSLSQGIGACSIRGGWVGQLHARLLAEGRPVRLVNLSVAGARMHDVADRQLPQLAALGVVPALVTVLVGANDMVPRGRRAAAASYPRILAALPRGRSVAGPMPRRNGGAAAINALIDEAAAAPRIISTPASAGTRTSRGASATPSTGPSCRPAAMNSRPAQHRRRPGR
jgi:acyl-CoA thioesterase-1